MFFAIPSIFIDFHSVNLGLCAFRRGDSDPSNRREWARDKPSGVATSTGPRPTSSLPPRHNGACARRGGTHDPAPKLWGLQSRPLCLPGAKQPSWGLHLPFPSSCQHKCFGEKPGTCLQPLSPADPAGEAPTPAPSLAVFTCAVPSGACSRADNRNGREVWGVGQTESTTRDSQIRSLLFGPGVGVLDELSLGA